MYLESDFAEDSYVDTINSINNYTNNLSLSDINGDMIVLKDIPSGDFHFAHGLKRIPIYKLILRQVGGGLVLDQSKSNTDGLMFLHNGGSIINELIIKVG